MTKQVHTTRIALNESKDDYEVIELRIISDAVPENLMKTLRRAIESYCERTGKDFREER